MDTDQVLEPDAPHGSGATKAYLVHKNKNYQQFTLDWECTANCCDDDMVLHRERCNTCALPGEGGGCEECRKHWTPDSHCEDCTTGYYKDSLVPENERCAETNLPGNTCLDSVDNRVRLEMCSTGICKADVCCSADVVAERCNACSSGNGVVAGGCLECTEGYAGKYCTSCIAETHFLKGDECVRKLDAGSQCVDNRQCESNSCNGVHCCQTRKLGIVCEDCGGVNGTCVACKKAARSPELDCEGCIDSYYMPQVGSGSPACVPKKEPGFTCSSDIACLSLDCKRNRCCDATVQNTNPQCIKCGTMDNGGLCVACATGYTVDPEDFMCKEDCPVEGGGGVKHHNEIQERLRFYQETVGSEYECAGQAKGKNYKNVQTQTRTCSDGTWLDWVFTKSHSSEIMFRKLVCVKGCIDERGREVQGLMKGDTNGMIQDQYNGGWRDNAPWDAAQKKYCGIPPREHSNVLFPEFFRKDATRTTRYMYKELSVPYGGKCQKEQQLSYCINGVWGKWMGGHWGQIGPNYIPDRDPFNWNRFLDHPQSEMTKGMNTYVKGLYVDQTTWTRGTYPSSYVEKPGTGLPDGEKCEMAGKSMAGQVRVEGLDKNRVLYTENKCSVECAPGCTAEMRDDDLCHDECENTNCCFNYGACATAATELLTKARWAVISGDKVTAKPLLETLCFTPSYNPETNMTGQAACTLLSNVNGGYDYFGNEMNFVHPLQWEEYELVVNNYAAELAVIEDRLGEAAIMQQNADHFGKLRNKMLLLSLGQRSITDQVTGLDASTKAGFAQIDGLVQDLAQEQRDQFATMQENFDEVMVGQEDAMLASQANFNGLEEAEQQRFEELQKDMDDGFTAIRDDIEIMEGNILLGQDALGDSIEENGEAIGDMAVELAEMKNILLENQDLLEGMLNGYTQDKQQLIGLEQTQADVYADFKPKSDQCVFDKKTGEKVAPDVTTTCYINAFDGILGVSVDGKTIEWKDMECFAPENPETKVACRLANVQYSRLYVIKVTFQGFDDTVLGLLVNSNKRTNNRYQSAFSVVCEAADHKNPWHNVGDNLNSFKMRNLNFDSPKLDVNTKYSTKDLDDSTWESGDDLTVVANPDKGSPYLNYYFYSDEQSKTSWKYKKVWAGKQVNAPITLSSTFMVRIRSNEVIKDMLPAITGMDKNGNNQVESNELQVFMDSYGMYRTSMAPVMARIVHDGMLANDELTWEHMIVKLKAEYGAVHVEFSLSNFGVEEDLPAAEWDLNEDDILDDDEMLHIISEKGMLMQKGRQLKERWEAMIDDVADDGGDRRARAVRVKRGLGVEVKVEWSDFIKAEYDEITNVLDFTGDRFCIQKVTGLMKRLWGQVLALWTTAVEAATTAAAECSAAVANLVAGVLSFNPIAIGKGLLGGAECAKNVMELLQLKEEIPAIKATIRAVEKAVKEGHSAVKSWVNDVRSLPNDLLNFACNAVTRGLEVSVDFTWSGFPDELPCLSVASEGGTCGDGPNPVPQLDPPTPPAVCLNGDCTCDGEGGDPDCSSNPPYVDPEPEVTPEVAIDLALKDVLGQADVGAALSPCDQYQVVRGDTLSHIALAYRNEGYTDVTWQKICEYNNLDTTDRKGDNGVVACDYIVPGQAITVCSDNMERGTSVTIEPYRAGTDRHRRRRRSSKVPGRHAERLSAVPEHMMSKIEPGKNSVVSLVSNDRREKFSQTLKNTFKVRRSQLSASSKHKDLMKQNTLRGKQANELKKVMNKKSIRDDENSGSNRHRRGKTNTEISMNPHEHVEHGIGTLHRTRHGFGAAESGGGKKSRDRRAKKKKRPLNFASLNNPWTKNFEYVFPYNFYDPAEFCRNNPYHVFKGNVKSEPRYQPPPDGTFGYESWIDCFVDFWQSVVPPNWKELATGVPLKVCARDQITDVATRNVILLEQRQQDLVYRVAELLYKERRQMEYYWLEYPDVEFPSELTAQKLLQHQAQLRDWNLQQKEEKSTFKSIGWSSFTVDRTQYPEQFAKLGTSTVLIKNGTVVPNQRSSTEMSFYIGAPAEVNFWHAEVKDVKVVIYPLKSKHYKDIMVKITKGAESHFFTKDGTRDTMKTFTHRERTFYREYRMNSCETVSVEEDTGDYVSVSPYGMWKVDIQPAYFGDAAALQGVDRIEFRFKLSKAPVEQPQAGLPLFDGDRFADGITGTTSLSYQEADCAVSLFEACLPNPCLNGATCHPALSSVAGSPDFECDCTADWEGKVCGTPNPIEENDGVPFVDDNADDDDEPADSEYEGDVAIDDDEYEDEGPEPTLPGASTTTTTTIFDVDDVDCVEMQDPCTALCQLGFQRNYELQSPAVKGGHACTGALDCHPGDGDCAADDEGADTTAEDDHEDATTASAAGASEGLDMTFFVAVGGLLVGIVILVLAIVQCRRASSTPAQAGRKPVSASFVNPVYGESTTTDDGEVAGGFA